MKKDIDFKGIIVSGLGTTWKNPFLWVFGLLISVGNVTFNLGYSKNQASQENWVQNWEWLAWMGLLVVISGVIALSFRAVGLGGLISSLERIESGKSASLKEGWAVSRIFFKKIFLLEIIINVFLAGVLVVLFVPAGFLIMIKEYNLAFLSGAVAALLFLVILVPALFIRRFAVYYLVLGRLSLVSSMENGYSIFRKHLKDSIKMGIMAALLGAACLFVLFWTVALILLSVAVPFLFVFIVLFGESGAWMALAAAVILVIGIVVFLRAVFETFYESAWFLFYRSVAKVDDEDDSEGVLVEAEKKLHPSHTYSRLAE